MFSMLFTGYFYLIEDQCVVFSKSSFFFFVDSTLWLIVTSWLFIVYWQSITKYSVTVLLQSIAKYSVAVLLHSIAKYSMSFSSLLSPNIGSRYHCSNKYNLSVNFLDFNFLIWNYWDNSNVTDHDWPLDGPLWSIHIWCW